MRNPYIISQLISGKWLIDPGFADTQAPVVANLLNNYVEIERQEPDKLTGFAVVPVAAGGKTAKYSYYDGFERAPSGSVAVINLNGVLLKNDQYCGPAGMATIGEIIKAAEAHENIAAIVLKVDSPGGTVDGTEALANIYKSVTKPKITFVDGLMASAALWIGSGGDEIIASTDTDEIGSVGVILSFADVQPYWEKMGIKFHKIAASTSPEKQKAFDDLRAGKYDDYRKNVLDPLDEKFMNVIRENLPNVKDEHLTGKVFFARDLMGTVVNRIGTLDDAINRAWELAQERKPLNTGDSKTNNAFSKPLTDENGNEIKNVSIVAPVQKPDTSISNSDMKQFKHVNSALGVESLESEDGTVSLNEEQLEALDNSIASNNSPELQNQLDAANDTIAQQTSTISERDATIASQTAEIARLKGKPAEITPVAKTSGDDQDLNKNKGVTVVSDDDDFATQVQKVSDEYLARH